jgi:hypothetical protein
MEYVSSLFDSWAAPMNTLQRTMVGRVGSMEAARSAIASLAKLID